MFEQIKTAIVAAPIPIPFIAEVVVASVGHIPKTNTKVGLFFTIPSIRYLNLLITFSLLVVNIVEYVGGNLHSITVSS